MRTRTSPLLLGALGAAAVAVAACDRGAAGGDAGRAPDTAGAAGSVAGAAAPTMFGYRIVNVFPHDTSAYTQGLVWHEGKLYEGTGVEGASSLRRVDLSSGVVERRVPLGNEHFGEGIAILGDTVYQITWRSGKAFSYDLGTFAPRDTFTYAGEGWGLTTDGTSLIMSDGTNRLRFLDPATFEVRRTLEVVNPAGTVSQLNELELVDGELLANIWRSNYIARIDTATGRVTGFIDLSSLRAREPRADEENVLNGIAWDPERRRLFVTGKRWSNLYEIEIVRQ